MTSEQVMPLYTPRWIVEPMGCRFELWQAVGGEGEPPMYLFREDLIEIKRAIESALCRCRCQEDE